ncbi:MAG: type IV pilus modification protein PilV [Gammaproteobacteria bacterium]|nr:type IV pilus modification protein PilV [Gammaproteobacteria bacterium]MDH5629555.1 type IV pilus modification protein PilV [Gammaproteobacteria bacterium]
MLRFVEPVKQLGVSLIEILVTVLILGIGLLGVAALQVSSLASNQEGFFTTQATSIAEDLSSRMRATKITTMLPSTDVDHASLIANYISNVPFACDAAPKLCTNGTSCTLAEVAVYDKYDICNIAQNTLPGGLVRVIGSTSRLTVVVEWDSAAARTDIGNRANVNANCAVLTGDAERNCVLMEIVP